MLFGHGVVTGELKYLHLDWPVGQWSVGKDTSNGSSEYLVVLPSQTAKYLAVFVASGPREAVLLPV